MTEEKDQIRPTTYDGIQEYDNQLPRWWLITLILTIIFAFIYWSRYFVFESAPNQKAELMIQMDKMDEKVEKTSNLPSSEDLLAMSKNPDVLDRGSVLYQSNCVQR